MSTLHKLQTLLTDLRDKIQRRQWHVHCCECHWQVHNLDHERFAIARGKMHSNTAHTIPPIVVEYALRTGRFMPALYEVTFTRA